MTQRCVDSKGRETGLQITVRRADAAMFAFAIMPLLKPYAAALCFLGCCIIPNPRDGS